MYVSVMLGLTRSVGDQAEYTPTAICGLLQRSQAGRYLIACIARTGSTTRDDKVLELHVVLELLGLACNGISHWPEGRAGRYR